MFNKTSQTHIAPDYSKKAKVTYTIEYTEKDESIKDDYSNVKKVNCLDLEEMLTSMFQLRQLNKFNIDLYTMTELENKFIWEDSVGCCERYSGNEIEKKQQKSIGILEKTMEDQQKEIDLLKYFLTKYNSLDIFEKFKKGEENKFTYYFRLRPPSPCCQPSKGILETNGEKIMHNDREYWGSCTYDRELSKSELYDYDLDN